jgi:septal ring factor EnvC (AmiA/AmiB activator)
MRVFIILLVLVTFAVAESASAAEPRGANRVNAGKKLEVIKKKLRESRIAAKGYEARETSLLSEIDKADRALMKHRKALKKIERKLRRAKATLRKTDKKITGLSKEKKQYQGMLESRLRAVYKMRTGRTMPVLFASFDSPEAARRYRYYLVVTDSDRELISGAERNIVTLRKERIKLASIKKEISNARGKVRRKKIETTRARSKKRNLLSGVRRKKENHASLLKELLRAEADLLTVLEGLGARALAVDDSEFGRMMGKLPRPVDGRIISSYGKKRHPRFKTITFNNGIVIKAAFGAEVRSVYNGRVVYVGWLKGYGQVLIMDNGGGYYTLFAYLSDILKNKGAQVRKGETIALVGDSGPKDITGLYFELRRGGVPKDPARWLAKR